MTVVYVTARDSSIRTTASRPIVRVVAQLLEQPSGDASSLGVLGLFTP